MVSGYLYRGCSSCGCHANARMALVAVPVVSAADFIVHIIEGIVKNKYLLSSNKSLTETANVLVNISLTMDCRESL